MCIAIPMKVLEVPDPLSAIAENGSERSRVNTELAGEVRAGDWILVFNGAAQRVMSEDEALEMRTALHALSDVMGGTATRQDVDDAFAVIIANTGKLPPHLQAQLDAQKKNS